MINVLINFINNLRCNYNVNVINILLIVLIDL
jgi:hypothetical protein